MDSDRFDIWTKRLTAGLASRRGAVRAITGVLLGGLALANPDGAAAACVKPGRKGCKGPKRKKCCRGAICKGGSKRKAGTCVCKGGLTKCGTRCVNASTDQRHCGGCDIACEDHEQCTGGNCCDQRLACGAKCCELLQRCVDDVCRDPSVNCAPPTQHCDGFCVNLNTDRNNCGSCGRQCASHLVCVNGTCGCPAGTIECGETCVDIRTDRDHCGGCGWSCGSDGHCGNGWCVVQGSCSAGANTCDHYEECAWDPVWNQARICVQSASGKTRCAGDYAPHGASCGECINDSDCTALHPNTPGVFCMAHTTGCDCAGSTRCQAGCEIF